MSGLPAWGWSGLFRGARHFHVDVFVWFSRGKTLAPKYGLPRLREILEQLSPELHPALVRGPAFGPARSAAVSSITMAAPSAASHPR
ncbi:MAG: hypothetical protein LBB76_11800 [Azoarcus sp.]|jgi:hypothetical protein|nr:hypothetical protein [Azoarcus sp.]